MSGIKSISKKPFRESNNFILVFNFPDNDDSKFIVLNSPVDNYWKNTFMIKPIGLWKTKKLTNG